jgi:ferredoxin
MTVTNPNILVCNCNQSMPLDGRAIAAGLGVDGLLPINQQLCRRQVGNFTQALAEGNDVIVACTQESPFFSEVHREAGSASRVRFANIRESAGWSREGAQATPKIAALLAAAALPDPEPVGTVSYKSEGRLLIVADAKSGVAWAERMRAQLDVSLLVVGGHRGAELPTDRRYAIYSGGMPSLSGWLGAFTAEWEQANPIDLELCTRCNACIAACPEDAIDHSYQVDLDRCRSHRACVRACGDVRAIDFDRVERARSDAFDLVLNLTDTPLFDAPDPPQGYFAPGTEPFEQALAVNQLMQMVGEFEKPKFFSYKARICAHGRSGIEGCSQCIDVCSTGAIFPDGDHVRVEPHLCMGCGGCATVCPSGAMSYAYQRMGDRGLQIRTLLQSYRKAGGRDACLLFHDPAKGRDLIARLGRGGAGLPARVIPIESFHIASIGIDLLLGAFALGASQVIVLATGKEPQSYLAALQTQMGYAEEILQGQGFEAEHFRLIRVGDERAFEETIWGLSTATGVTPAMFNLSNDKRGTLDFVFEHLRKNAPSPTDVLSLGAGAPFGQIKVNRETCTLCMSCVGACPENALADSKEVPRLSFIERNCVQCGLCASTCPESAITLEPRLLLSTEAKIAAVMNEAEPFHCVRCGKAFATRQMVDKMVGRLAAHSMFTETTALGRLRMCADCRVVDMVKEQKQISIFDV